MAIIMSPCVGVDIAPRELVRNQDAFDDRDRAFVLMSSSDHCVHDALLGELITWEFPRLCRGGSRSLTYAAVVRAGKLAIVET
jgi:hypothetical protein